MIFHAAGLSLYFNKTTFGVERLSVEGDPEAVSFVTGRTFGLPSGNNFLLESNFSSGTFSGKFLYFSEIVCTLVVKETEGAISFSYEFKNEGKKSVSLKEGDIGICTPFFDRFDDPELSLRRRVHAHVRTEGVTHVYLERYSGDLPSLGLVMTKGECFSYALERGAGKGVRGEIILRLPAVTLESGESYSCEFLLFPCTGREDFYKKANSFGFLTASANALTVWEDEEIVFYSEQARSLKTPTGEYPFADGVCRVKAKGCGEHEVKILSEKQTLLAKYFVLSKNLFDKRVSFVTENQFIKDGAFRGAFAALDRQNGEIVVRAGVRSPFNLGGFRAAPLLFLLRQGQKENRSESLTKIIEDSISFYNKEIYRSGEVSDDVGGKRAIVGRKYYNYPLFAAIKFEEYRLFGNVDALKESAEILLTLYRSGSVYEFAEAEDVVTALRKEDLSEGAEQLVSLISAAADKLIASGNKYASFKGLPYGPEIVYGSLSVLLEAYFLTGKEYYLLVAKEHFVRLSTFAFPSMNYATDEVPEIFQEDRGKKLIYDMSPHFTAIRFAAVYDRYARATGEGAYRNLARKIALACLTLFNEEGASYRSKAAAAVVNDTELTPYEEISCGEDVVLYHFDLLFGGK